MNLSRRNTIIGLGTLAGGAGVIVGSGAFSTVEAQRDVEIQTAGDHEALLALEPTGSGTIVDDSDDIIGFDVDGAAGVNQNAKTTFRPAVKATNNGSNDVGLYVADKSDIGAGDVLDFQIPDNGGQRSIVGETEAVTISANGGEIDIDLVIDLIDRDSSDLTNIEDVTFVADQEAVD